MITNFHTTVFKTAEERAAVSKLLRTERQSMIERLLVEYPIFDQVVDFIGKFHMPVEGGRHGRGVVGGLLGQTRAGKTDAIKYYCNRYPILVTPDSKRIRIIYAQITTDTSPVSLAEVFYTASGAESWPKMKASALVQNSVARLPRVGAQLVVIDDSHFMFTNRAKNVIKNFAGLLKQLCDLNEVNVLLVGEDSIEAFVESYPWLIGRGGFPKKRLRPLSDLDGEFEMFRLLLAKVDRRLPFARDSDLGEPAIARDLWLYSEGAIGKVMILVRAAALRALDADAPRIMREHLYEEAAMRQRIGDTYEYFSTRH